MSNQPATEEIYKELARIYDTAGLSDYADYYTPVYLQLLQQKGWVGRRVLDLGCGTGISMAAFLDQRLFITGVDSSTDMIAVAKIRFEDIQGSITFVNEDIRQYTPAEKAFDLVFCIGHVLNYMPTIRDIENIFQRVNWGLDQGKTFLFDLRTIEGLAQLLGNKTEIIHDSRNTFLVIHNEFNYETATLEQQYIFFYRDENNLWTSARETHILRGYPFRAVVNILQRTGFEVKNVLTLDLEPYETADDPYGRVVIIAEKVRNFMPVAKQGG